MTQVTVRRARQSELATVRNLNTELFPEAPMAAETYENSIWWLALVEGRAVGYSGLYLGIKNEAWLVRVGVLQAYRGGGLGARLVRSRLRYWKARAQAGDALRTYVADWNLASTKNVLKAGLFPYRAYLGWIYYELVR